MNQDTVPAKASSEFRRLQILNPFTRTLQRHFVPGFIVSIYYYFRFGCYVSAQAKVQLSSQIVFGKGTVVKPFAVISTQGGEVVFGKECAVSSFDHITNGIEPIRIGDYVRIGPHVTILGGSRNFQSREQRVIDQGSHHGSVVIGEDVLIGAGSVIMPGITVGKGAVIGALSLVNRDVADYQVVAGSPIQVLKERV
jgi:acetyltransferase-like isoleucine patch superfamily enzyme